MIIVDTNVLSELMQPAPHPSVLRWSDEQQPAATFTTAITIAEVRSGIERLDHGRRRADLDAAAREAFAGFADRVLPFDGPAAERFGVIIAARSRAGRPMAILDAQIAAICRATGASLATRNVRDFEGCGVDVVDPWAEPEDGSRR